MADKPLRVVLLWHMHQPDYRDALSGEYLQPWTYLHGIKDYVDMVALLEDNPAARAVVNFSPTLLEQIDDYAAQIEGYLKRGEPLRDPLLAALVQDISTLNDTQRLQLARRCLRANPTRMIDRFPAYRRLADLSEQMLQQPESIHYFSEQYLTDLLVWYHLAWMGETVRLRDERIKQLLQVVDGFSMQDRQQLLTIIGELVGGVLARYQALAENGRVELSLTPYGHPIMPLLLDIDSTHEAMPEAPLPNPAHYPCGKERVGWHIEEGLRVFEDHFGFRPVGCWPSEGAVSEATLMDLAKAGFYWAASGESVLRNSLKGADDDSKCIHRPYRLQQIPLTCFFRDDGLSDLIGFNYADWHSSDAVSNLLHHLENISMACADEPNRVVSIIMDGENAWEYYPHNGYHFLTELYERLAQHPQIELTTFEQCLEQEIQAAPLPCLVAGSWVYGTFSTWIGQRDKNRAWELLIEAKQVFDRVMAEGHLTDHQRQQAEKQLGICEASDWFWWFGGYNPAESVSEFDKLYRHQLQALYDCLGEPPPPSLQQVISRGGGNAEAGGVMRRGQESH